VVDEPDSASLFDTWDVELAARSYSSARNDKVCNDGQLTSATSWCTNGGGSDWFANSGLGGPQEWYQLDAGQLSIIGGVVIGGRSVEGEAEDEYLLTCAIWRSIDGATWTFDHVYERPASATDGKSLVKAEFRVPVQARFIRLYPLTWRGSASLRAALLVPASENAALAVPGGGFSEFIAVRKTSSSDRECQAVTTCSDATEYETVAPGRFSDRQCRPLTRCTDAEYESVAKTATTDRSCLPLTVCIAGVEYETTAATSTSDRGCLPLTVCEGESFESKAAFVFSDRECTVARDCNLETEYEAAPLTSSSDRVCASLTVCGLDDRERIAPTPTTDRRCEQVNDCLGNLCNEAGHGVCEDGVLSYSCRCEAGWDGDFCDCSRGGTFSTNGAGWGSPCYPFTTCADGEYEIVAPSDGKDRACAPISLACDPDTEFELSAPTAISDRECASLTVCSGADDLEEQVAATPSSDRECRPIDDCVDSTCLNNATCTDRHPRAGEYTCNCVAGWEGRLCDCHAEHTFSLNPTGWGTPCLPLTVCQEGEYEFAPPTNVRDRACRLATECNPVSVFVTDGGRRSRRGGDGEVGAGADAGSIKKRVLRSATDDFYTGDDGDDGAAYEYGYGVAYGDVDVEALAADPTTETTAAATTKSSTITDEPVAVSTTTAEATPATATSKTLTTTTVTSVVTATTETSITGTSTTILYVAEVPTFYETKPLTSTSDRECAMHTSCTSAQFELRPPTDFSDRDCESTTTTRTDTSATTTITTTYECPLACNNGGMCKLVQADCTDPDAPYDTPTCDCNPNGVVAGVCFYGKRCNVKVNCAADTLSCNVVDRVSLRSDPADLVCNSVSAWPRNLCTEDMPRATSSSTGTTTTRFSGVQCSDLQEAECAGEICGVCTVDDQTCVVDGGVHRCVATELIGREADLLQAAKERADGESGASGTSGSNKSASLNTAGALFGLLCIGALVMAALLFKRQKDLESEKPEPGFSEWPTIAGVSERDSNIWGPGDRNPYTMAKTEGGYSHATPDSAGISTYDTGRGATYDNRPSGGAAPYHLSSVGQSTSPYDSADPYDMLSNIQREGSTQSLAANGSTVYSMSSNSRDTPYDMGDGDGSIRPLGAGGSALYSMGSAPRRNTLFHESDAEAVYEFGAAVEGVRSRARETVYDMGDDDIDYAAGDTRGAYSKANAGGAADSKIFTFQSNPYSSARAGSSRGSSRRSSSTFRAPGMRANVPFSDTYDIADRQAASVRRGSHAETSFANPDFVEEEMNSATSNTDVQMPLGPEATHVVRPESYHHAVCTDSEDQGSLGVRSDSYHNANSDEPQFVEQAQRPSTQSMRSIQISGTHAEMNDV
jgi:hypothetical protein